jgi:CRP-like cAMP-binding protein
VTATTEQILEILTEHELLGRLDAETLSSVALAATERSLAPLEAVARQGQPADRFFLLLEGRCRATATRPDGGQLTLSVLKPGSLFGLVGLMDHAERPATFAALEPSRLLELPAQLLQGAPSTREGAAALAITEVLAISLNHQLRSANQRLFLRAAELQASQEPDDWEARTEGGWKAPE